MIEKRRALPEETAGKNKGCWVMRRAGSDTDAPEQGREGLDEDAKILVRSNGTVTYVGKDIAYHLWKFGLLPGKDFGYTAFHADTPNHTLLDLDRSRRQQRRPSHFRSKPTAIVQRHRFPPGRSRKTTWSRKPSAAWATRQKPTRYTHFSTMLSWGSRRAAAIELGYLAQ